MEEDEYKSTYNVLASVPCVFEKALTNNQARCHLAQHFCLADREGYSCDDVESSIKCGKLLKKLRKKSAFVLKLRNVDEPLPHNMEIRVQVGGLRGLLALVAASDDTHPATVIEDINGCLNMVMEKFGSLQSLPYGEIIQSVVKFQGRRRRQR